MVKLLNEKVDRIIDWNDVSLSDDGTIEGTVIKSTGAGDGKVLTANGSNGATWAPASGGGTSRWHVTMGGYKTNNGSSSVYYMQYYPNNNNWNNSESSPTSINYFDMYAAEWIAPANGTITRLDVMLRMAGTADDLKFYVFKGTPSEATAYDDIDLSLLVTSDAVGATTTNKGYFSSTTFSSSNTFSAGDCLFIMLKKETHNGSTHHYFSGVISGEYT